MTIITTIKIFVSVRPFVPQCGASNNVRHKRTHARTHTHTHTHTHSQAHAHALARAAANLLFQELFQAITPPGIEALLLKVVVLLV